MSDVYTEALDRAKASTEVTQALGTPLKEGFMVSGTIDVSGSAGHADIAIPISGPLGKGIIYAVATKTAGRCIFTSLEVHIKGSRTRINLLHTVVRSDPQRL